MSKNITTPEFRASYPKLFKAEVNRLSGKSEFSVVALFKKGEDLSALKKAVEDCLIEKFGADKGKWPKKLKLPFRDQGEKENDGEMPQGYVPGGVFMNLKTSKKPGIVDQNVQAIIDENEVYAGCYLRASVRPFYYDQAGNKGVSFGLQNIQKVRDGEPLGGGRSKPENDFSAVASSSSSDEDSIWN